MPFNLDDTPVLAPSLQALALQRCTLLPTPVPPPEPSQWAAFARHLGLGLACSDFINEVLLRAPSVLNYWLQTDADDGLAYWQRSARQAQIHTQFAALQTHDDEASMLRALRQLRAQEMALIAWRDLTSLACVNETLSHLSTVADAAVVAALAFAERELSLRYGQAPAHNGTAQQLLIVGMGKLGGQELNFSSDIDLIFLYGDDGANHAGGAQSRAAETLTTGPKRIDYRDYFSRIGQRVLHLLSTPTADGIVFRTDMRLRPYGDSGPLALSLDALEEYYQDQGREWERFAAVKARAITGDAAARLRFADIQRPFVYRRYIDFSVLEAIRRLKLMIAQDLRRKPRGDNIKLGQGGIREIEFIVQAHQLIRGGRDASLRERALQPMLQRLSQLQHLTGTDAQILQDAYLFLRKLENCLQALRDEQTQTLPQDSLAQSRLACALAYPDYPALATQIDAHRAEVHRIFLSVFGDNENDLKTQAMTGEGLADCAAVWRHENSLDNALAILTQRGFAEPAAALEQIRIWRDTQNTRVLSERGRQRLDLLMPALIVACGAQGGALANTVLVRVIQLLHAIARRTAYLELLAENRASLSHLVRLCAQSTFIAEQLIVHPVLLDELLDAKTLYAPPTRGEMQSELQQSLLRIEIDDQESLLDALRIFRHANTLRLAAATISEALDLAHVSERLTDLAEVVLDEVLQLAWQQLTGKHGLPPRLETALATAGISAHASMQDKGFCIIAYGKFGGAELSFASDLDLVFLYSGDQSLSTDGARPLPIDQFYTRLAQRVVHFLNTRTPTGLLYEVDTRLRPSGNSGLLVSHIQGFEYYQLVDAWTWEHQALVRARPVAGDHDLALRFNSLRAQVLARPRTPSELSTEVQNMRARMRTTLDKSTEQFWDLKHGPGGIVDIEFIVQFLVLRDGHDLGRAGADTHSVRLLQSLAQRQSLPSDSAEHLIRLYKFYRQQINTLALDGRNCLLAANAMSVERSSIETLWAQCFAAE